MLYNQKMLSGSKATMPRVATFLFDYTFKYLLQNYDCVIKNLRGFITVR